MEIEQERLTNMHLVAKTQILILFNLINKSMNETRKIFEDEEKNKNW